MGMYNAYFDNYRTYWGLFLFTGMGCKLRETKDDITITFPKSDHLKSLPPVWLFIPKAVLLEIE